jgi:hypothetical protein
MAQRKVPWNARRVKKNELGSHRNWYNQHPTKTVFEGASAFIDEMRTNAAAARR